MRALSIIWLGILLTAFTVSAEVPWGDWPEGTSPQSTLQWLRDPASAPAGVFGDARCLTPQILALYDWQRRNPALLAWPLAPQHPTEALQETIGTSHFLFHYELVGPDACSDTNYVRTFADIFEHCWAIEVDSLGHRPPPPDGTYGGDARYDVTIKSLAGNYGQTWPNGDGPNPWNDQISYIEVNKSYAGFPANEDPDGTEIGCMRVTAAHEFYHAVQMAYGADTGQPWMFELSAVWMENYVYPATNDYLRYVRYFTEKPQLSLFGADAWHMYGAGPFGQFVENQWGPEAWARIWDNTRATPNPLDALRNYLDMTSLGTNGTMTMFFNEMWFTGPRARSGGFDSTEAHKWPVVVTEKEVAGCDLGSYVPSASSPDHRLQGWSWSAMSFLPLEREGSSLNVIFNGNAAGTWQLGLLHRGNGSDSLDYILPVGSTRVSFALEANQCQEVLTLMNVGTRTTGASYNLSVYQGGRDGAGPERLAWADPESMRSLTWPVPVVLPSAVAPDSYQVTFIDSTGTERFVNTPFTVMTIPDDLHGVVRASVAAWLASGVSVPSTPLQWLTGGSPGETLRTELTLPGSAAIPELYGYAVPVTGRETYLLGVTVGLRGSPLGSRWVRMMPFLAFDRGGRPGRPIVIEDTTVQVPYDWSVVHLYFGSTPWYCAPGDSLWIGVRLSESRDSQVVLGYTDAVGPAYCGLVGGRWRTRTELGDPDGRSVLIAPIWSDPDSTGIVAGQYEQVSAEVTLWPNPAPDHVRITLLPGGSQSIKIVSLASGEVMGHYFPTKSRKFLDLDTSGWPRGVYLVQTSCGTATLVVP